MNNKFLSKKASKRNVSYEYKIKDEDIGKIPKFHDTEFRYHVVQNAYTTWRKENKKHSKGKYIRDFEKIWKIIAEEMFEEMADNIHGVKLPNQLGSMYIANHQDKEYLSLLDKEHIKVMTWSNNDKYCNKLLSNYFYNTRKTEYVASKERAEKRHYKTSHIRPHRKDKLI